MPNEGLKDTQSVRWEGPVLWGLLAVLLAVNLLTGERCPAVWIDEVTYLDPAWQGRGFTSSAYYVQADGEF